MTDFKVGDKVRYRDNPYSTTYTVEELPRPTLKLRRVEDGSYSLYEVPEALEKVPEWKPRVGDLVRGNRTGLLKLITKIDDDILTTFTATGTYPLREGKEFFTPSDEWAEWGRLRAAGRNE